MYVEASGLPVHGEELWYLGFFGLLLRGSSWFIVMVSKSSSAIAFVCIVYDAVEITC
jgi:hypothetical protein